MQNKNMLAATEAKWEFKKTARQETPDSYSCGIWDDFGRFFVLQGMKPPGPWDKGTRHIKIFNIFGEPMQSVDKIPELSNFMWRPRHRVLDKKTLKTIQKDYRKLYGKEYRKEEMAERAIIQQEINQKKKSVRDEFLANFFLPMRQKYENDMSKYQEMWPLKESDMAEEAVTVRHVYQY